MSKPDDSGPPAFVPLATFGRRICICGPSNAGKSTLAVAIGGKLGLPVVHLDLLRFLPNTNWRIRPDEDFARLHDAAIAGDGWVVEGNYSTLLPQRLAAATGIVLLKSGRWAGLARYLRRTLFERHRRGQLDGARDSVKWRMIHWIVIAQPSRQRAMATTLRASGLPLIEVTAMGDLARLYAEWRLPSAAVGRGLPAERVAGWCGRRAPRSGPSSGPHRPRPSPDPSWRGSATSLTSEITSPRAKPASSAFDPCATSLTMTPFAAPE